ncbi:MAG: hypothetical protein MI725_00270 [Pirellulales bacterium]|nr:hypothetical protein [Pirellulales bacterium]
MLSEIQPDRHGEAAHYLFADGHVQALAAATLQNWAGQGYNFALPDNANLLE